MVDRSYDKNGFSDTEQKRLDVINLFMNTGKKTIHELYELPDTLELNIGYEIKDIRLSEETYNEYFNGMIKFIREVLSIDDTDTETADKFNNELNNAKEKDKSFIDGLFIQTGDDKVTCVCILKNNIDYLCDIANTIKKYKLNVKSLIDSFNYENSNVKSHSIEFMETSVNYYLQSILFYIQSSLNTLISNKDKSEVSNINKGQFRLFL
jgi:hypothetical protein|nr:MAG TPA: hypothetical protein [Caudoviricetes sp.]